MMILMDLFAVDHPAPEEALCRRATPPSPIPPEGTVAMGTQTGTGDEAGPAKTEERTGELQRNARETEGMRAIITIIITRALLRLERTINLLCH